MGSMNLIESTYCVFSPIPNENAQNAPPIAEITAPIPFVIAVKANNFQK